MAAAIQPNTGIEAIAAPTARKAPASVKLAVAPATAPAVLAACAVVFATVEPVFAMTAVVCDCFATACAVVEATVFAVVAASACFSAVSSACATLAACVIFVHHCFSEFIVTSLKALSLFSACETCCRPIVIDINCCTLSIAFCKSSFSPVNNEIADEAAVNPPTTPCKPLMTP